MKSNLIYDLLQRKNMFTCLQQRWTFMWASTTAPHNQCFPLLNSFTITSVRGKIFSMQYLLVDSNFATKSCQLNMCLMSESITIFFYSIHTDKSVSVNLIKYVIILSTVVNINYSTNYTLFRTNYSHSKTRLGLIKYSWKLDDLFLFWKCIFNPYFDDNFTL